MDTILSLHWRIVLTDPDPRFLPGRTHSISLGKVLLEATEVRKPGVDRLAVERRVETFQNVVE